MRRRRRRRFSPRTRPSLGARRQRTSRRASSTRSRCVTAHGHLTACCATSRVLLARHARRGRGSEYRHAAAQRMYALVPPCGMHVPSEVRWSSVPMLLPMPPPAAMCVHVHSAATRCMGCDPVCVCALVRVPADAWSHATRVVRAVWLVPPTQIDTKQQALAATVEMAMIKGACSKELAESPARVTHSTAVMPSSMVRAPCTLPPRCDHVCRAQVGCPAHSCPHPPDAPPASCADV
jgi:hypothetical protein